MPTSLSACLLALPCSSCPGISICVCICIHTIFKYRWKFVCILYEIKCRLETEYLDILEWERTNSPSTISFVIRNDLALIWPFIHNTPITCTAVYTCLYFYKGSLEYFTLVEHGTHVDEPALTVPDLLIMSF